MTGRDIYEGYGQTETILLCGNFADSPLRPGSMGRPAPGVPLYVIDEAGATCPVGVEGDIAVKMDRTPSSRFLGIFDGYLGVDGTLDRRLVRGPNNEEWYQTGDKATVDDDGYFWYVGRSDDVINSSGYRIGPFEVESTLQDHAAVVESAVVSSPDPNRGEVVKAFIVLAKEYEKADRARLTKELQDFCKAHAAPYKYPHKLAFVSAEWLAGFKTTSGKTQRKRLRDLEWRAPIAAKL
jgi:medium-chain acyl-CoA synthetase